MCRRLWAFLLCVGLLPCIPSRADDSKDLAALLSRADVTARGFRGEFEIFGGYDQPKTPLDFRTDDLRPKSKGRLWVKGDDALVELLGNPATTPPGSVGPHKDIIQVLAASKAGTFDFTPSSSDHGILKAHAPDHPEWVRNRIDSQILDYLNAISTINDFKIESALASGDGVVRADPAKGQYSITARRNDPKNPSTLIHDLTVTDQTVRCSSKLTVGPPASAIIIETLAEGDILNGTLIPRRVAKRTSAPAWGDVGPGQRDVTREVALFTPKDLEPAPFPITADFFQKYGRTHPTIQGDVRQSGEPIIAMRLLVLVLGILLAASVAAAGFVLWRRSQGSPSTSKKPKGPFRDLL